MFAINQVKSANINRQQKEINDGVNTIRKLSKYNLQEKLNLSSQMAEVELERDKRQV